MGQIILPDFIVIGAMKGGTTSLFRYLNVHPDIGMGCMKSTHELSYFVQEKNYSKGLEWYSSKFPYGKKVYGEVSTNYTKYPNFKDVPERIYLQVPDVKLIYVVRDPIERILSQYIHLVVSGEETRSLDDAIYDIDDNYYVNWSKYHMQLEQYMKYFSREQLLIIQSHDLRHHRRDTLRQIFSYIGVDIEYYNDIYDREYHRSHIKRKRNTVSQTLGKMESLYMLEPFIPEILYNVYHKVTRSYYEKPVFRQENILYLNKRLSGDIDAFRKIYNSTDSWNNI